MSIKTSEDLQMDEEDECNLVHVETEALIRWGKKKRSDVIHILSYDKSRKLHNLECPSVYWAALVHTLKKV